MIAEINLKMLRICNWTGYKQHIFPLFILFIIISLNASNVSAGVATLSWDAPTTNADGTILTDLAGYNLYYGMSSGIYSQAIDVGNVTTYTATNLTGGVTYYFAATAYDIFGNESAYSKEVSTSTDPPIADFHASPTSGALPLYVSFTDASANRPNVWSWSFGDGGTSSLQNPGYTYKEAGTYTISLTVSNANGTDRETKTSYLTVWPCQNQSIRIKRTTTTYYYSTLRAAYDFALDGDIIELHAADFAENLSFNRNIVVILKGGYDCGYTSIPADATTIIGIIQLLEGTVIFNNIALQ